MLMSTSPDNNVESATISCMVISPNAPRKFSTACSKAAKLLISLGVFCHGQAVNVETSHRHPPQPRGQFGWALNGLIYPESDCVLEDGLRPLREHRRKLQASQQCKIALAIGDTNRDELLSRNMEYVRFVNQLSSQQFSAITSFDELPPGLQANYDQNAGEGGEIDIGGSKPGQTPTAAQEAQVSALCDSTIAALSGDTVATQPSNALSPSLAPQPTAGGGSSGGGAPAADCTGTVSRSQCNTFLAIADLSRDDLLNESEYIRFLSRLSGNEYAGATFDSLPGNIQANFQKFATESGGQVNVFGSKPGQSADDAQIQFVDDFCCETDLAVSNPGSPPAQTPSQGTPTQGTPTAGPPVGTPTQGGSDTDCTGTIARSQCNTALSIADISRDDLMDESEYIRFVNRLAKNEYAGRGFDQLPGNVQDNFSQFATSNGQIDIFGSKPGQSPTAQQDELLNTLCCQTDLAVQNPGPATPSATPPSSGSQPSTPTPAESFPPTFSQTFCRTQMASSDYNRDDKMDDVEYVRFLNRLTSNAFSTSSFDELDSALQLNFANLAVTDGQIDIFGSRPGQTPDDSQNAFLDKICLDTTVALDGGGNAGGGSTSPPVDQPSGGDTSLSPTFGETTCYTSMSFADLNQDDYLNEGEFVRLVNRLAGNQYAGQTFPNLPDPLQAAYSDLSSNSNNGQIYVFGSKAGQTPTAEQEAFLGEICQTIAVALGDDGGPPSAPTPPSGGNSTSSPPFAPGMSEAYNSFIVANSLGLTAKDLQTGVNRDGLNNAYGQFAVKATSELSAVVAASNRRKEYNLRRRKLVVSLSPDSDEIYLVVDSTCPEDVAARSSCQTAYAKFGLTITDEDPQEISDEYTAATQAMISNGLLQTTLTEVDPTSQLSIVNASFPARATLPPTPAPDGGTSAPSPSPLPEGGGGSKSLAGPIVGGLFGGILLCAAIGYVSTKGLPFSVPSFGRSGKLSHNKDGGADDDGSAAGGGFGDDDNAFADEDDDDEHGQEQNPTKNMFGFGKRNKPDSDNQGFGEDDDESEDAFGTNKDGGNDNLGGMYAFDEPSEVAEKEENDGSVGGNDEVFGAGPSSPGWGNSNNVFERENQGWGSNENDQLNNEGGNFFGDSAFGDEDEEGSNSGSDSEYSSSEDSTYQSDNVDGEDNSAGNSYDEGDEEDESASRSSANDESESYNSGSTPTSLESELRRKNEEMEAAIASGDWDAVAEAADTFGKGQDSSLEGSSKKDSLEDDDNDEDDSYSGSSRSGSETGSGVSESSATTTTEQREERAEYRAQVDALVRLVLPDETDKVDAMMEQFKGREAELVSTLQTMQERSANQRARAAVHKSKNRPQRPEGADGTYALGTAGGVQGGEGGAAGTAAIAAASLPIPAAGMFDEGDVGVGHDGQGSFGQDAFSNEAAPAGDLEEEGSYYSEEGSRSQYSDEEPFSDEESRSRYSEEGSRSQSYTEGSNRSRSQYSGEGSRSYVSGEGSQSDVSGKGSYRSGEGSRSYNSGEGSQSYISGEGSQSYRSGEGSQSQSYRSGEGSQSQSGEGSQSYRSGEGSQSYISGEGSQSGDEEGSFDEGPFSDEGSQYSGEEGSYYSGEEGEGSHNGK
ncbi:hypothetical protein IV203_029398 [Nitzschia inconspicua]|uniref:Uncharacterized protein n=1 Tax=Nitzschia inconspicua TaxID=303405 RepID=A0A9K3LQN0_9STRA|nr:hypothetical protein IV203_029398 [Nitzschia inconspicua]